jgi:hypothetical protein
MRRLFSITAITLLLSGCHSAHIWNPTVDASYTHSIAVPEEYPTVLNVEPGSTDYQLLCSQHAPPLVATGIYLQMQPGLFTNSGDSGGGHDLPCQQAPPLLAAPEK